MGDQDNQGQDDSQVAFETKAIFSLADFLKTLSANEYYDLAQKLYNEWSEQDQKQPLKKLEPLIKIYERQSQARVLRAFNKWKQLNSFADLLEENEKLRQYIQMLVQENEQLSQERNILELQTKKRNQNNAHIQPLRLGRRTSSIGAPSNQSNGYYTNRSSSRGIPPQQFQDSSSIPIHERLHREAYKKTQQKIVYDVIKQRDELRDCTFKPGSSSQLETPSMNTRRREDPMLFERLSKSTKKYNPDLLSLHKENEELKACTFKPETNRKSKVLVEGNSEYQDKEKLYERLHKEGETKDQYMRSLQILKEHSEVNQCTFHPETNTNNKDSLMNSSRGGSNTGSDTYNRLHTDYERKQRNKVKVEIEHDQKFKENHPFQPTRVTKGKDSKLVGERKETSKQRTDRLYEVYKEREQKIALKKEELLKEEEKLHKITCKPAKNGRSSRQSLDHSTIQSHMQSFNSQIDGVSQQNKPTQQSHLDKLYAQGKDKQKRQDELREKIFKEQGYNFAPQTNSCKYQQLFENNDVIGRNREFLQKKENKIREIEQENACDFRPQRVTTQSKLSRQYDQQNVTDENWGDKLYAKAQEQEHRKERIRQESSVDRNCTFKPQLAKATERILRDSKNSQSRTGLTKSNSQHKFQGNSIPTEEDRQPFDNRTNYN